MHMTVCLTWPIRYCLSFSISRQVFLMRKCFVRLSISSAVLFSLSKAPDYFDALSSLLNEFGGRQVPYDDMVTASDHPPFVSTYRSIVEIGSAHATVQIQSLSQVSPCVDFEESRLLFTVRAVLTAQASKDSLLCYARLTHSTLFALYNLGKVKAPSFSVMQCELCSWLLTGM